MAKLNSNALFIYCLICVGVVVGNEPPPPSAHLQINTQTGQIIVELSGESDGDDFISIGFSDSGLMVPKTEDDPCIFYLCEPDYDDIAGMYLSSSSQRQVNEFSDLLDGMEYAEPVVADEMDPTVIKNETHISCKFAVPIAFTYNGKTLSLADDLNGKPKHILTATGISVGTLLYHGFNSRASTNMDVANHNADKITIERT